MSWSRIKTVAATPKNATQCAPPCGPRRSRRRVGVAPGAPVPPPSLVHARSPRRAAALRRRAISTGPPSSSTVARGRVGRDVAAGQRRPACRPATAGEVRGHRVGQRRPIHSSIRSSSSRPASLAQVLDGSLRARGRRPRRAARASARCRGPRRGRRRSATAVPGRGVAWISTSSGRQRHAAERDRAVRLERRRRPSGRRP